MKDQEVMYYKIALSSAHWIKFNNLKQVKKTRPIKSTRHATIYKYIYIIL